MYDEKWASSRYRVYNYIPYLQSLGVRTIVVSPPDRHILNRLGYLVSILYFSRRTDVVFIQKKIFKKGFLYLLHKLNPNIVFDMDDAIFARPSSVPSREFNEDRIRNGLNYLLQKSRIITAGNNFLKQYALQFNRDVHVIPTPILSERPTGVKKLPSDQVTIGWIGNHENLIYLDELSGVIQTLSRSFENRLIFTVICDEQFELQGVDIQNVKWSLSGEPEALMDIDIGIMPLREDEWSRGKCAFKLLQFMSFGIPVVASPVGMNREVIRHGENGYLAKTETEWILNLSALIRDRGLRHRFGTAGKRMVVMDYSYQKTSRMLFRVFQTCL